MFVTTFHFYFLLCVRAAAMTLRTVLLSLQALMAAAEPDDPQDAVVAKQYKENHDTFVMTAEHWTNVYANGKFFFRIIICLKYEALKNETISKRHLQCLLRRT